MPMGLFRTLITNTISVFGRLPLSTVAEGGQDMVTDCAQMSSRGFIWVSDTNMKSVSEILADCGKLREIWVSQCCRVMITGFSKTLSGYSG